MADDLGRVCVLFHESEILGAGVSVLRALEQLGGLGWTASGWFPGPGPLVDAAAPTLGAIGVHEKPIAFSARQMRIRAVAPSVGSETTSSSHPVAVATAQSTALERFM